MLPSVLLLLFLVAAVQGQTCSVPVAGPCAGSLCPTGLTCIPSGCCDSASVVTTPPQTCGDSGVGQCLGDQCPAGATCISSGGTTFCCANNMIGVTTPPPTLPPPPPPTTLPPTGCRDNVSANCAGITNLCNNQLYYNLMISQCPVTCGRCGVATIAPGVAGCSDNSSINCASLRTYCSNTLYRDLMISSCPVTCGFCSLRVTTPAPVAGCVDQINPNTGSSDCPRLVSYCTNALYYTLMTQQCPHTCNRCSSLSTTTCVDQINPNTGSSDCPSMATYCNNPTYYSLMTQQCPFTCSRCSTSSSGSSSGTSTNCVDQVNPANGVNDCPTMATYCTDPQYQSIMATQCPRTCGRCVAGEAVERQQLNNLLLIEQPTGGGDLHQCGLYSYCYSPGQLLKDVLMKAMAPVSRECAPKDLAVLTMEAMNSVVMMS